MNVFKMPISQDKKPVSITKMEELLAEKYEEKPDDTFRLEFRGEASRNQIICAFLAKLKRKGWNVSPCLMTCLPKDEKGRSFLNSAINILNADYVHDTPAFEWIIWSTSEAQRKKKFSEVMSLTDISKLLEKLPEYKPGKITLSFSLDADIDPSKLRNIFDPEKFNIRLIPHEGLEFSDKDIRKELKSKGYEVKK